MAFEEGGKYEADNGDIYAIRLDTDRYAVAGTAPASATTQPQTVIVSKGSREFGLRPRGVRLSRTIGTAPDTFKKYSFLPVLSASEFDVAPFKKGETITISGTAWTVSALVPENAG